MSKQLKVQRDSYVFPGEKPEIKVIEKPKSNPKQCWRCKGWMSALATDCPYCSLPMGRPKS